ncbi:hypothetical protein [Streptomyces sp. NPDC056690]|uniref:hypothetical protein n=1 Tax=unclassified Streptomyces TaxID=2593676 RepID=UPI003640E4E8
MPARITEAALRARILEQAEARQLAQLAAEGTVTAVGLLAIRKTHRIEPGLAVGLARHLDRIETAVALLPLLHASEFESVFNDWNPNRCRPDAADPPAMPGELFDALLNASSCRSPGF